MVSPADVHLSADIIRLHDDGHLEEAQSRLKVVLAFQRVTDVVEDLGVGARDFQRRQEETLLVDPIPIAGIQFGRVSEKQRDGENDDE